MERAGLLSLRFTVGGGVTMGGGETTWTEELSDGAAAEIGLVSGLMLMVELAPDSVWTQAGATLASDLGFLLVLVLAEVFPLRIFLLTPGLLTGELSGEAEGDFSLFLFFSSLRITLAFGFTATLVTLLAVSAAPFSSSEDFLVEVLLS